jgi:hypothetical protein
MESAPNNSPRAGIPAHGKNDSWAGCVWIFLKIGVGLYVAKDAQTDRKKEEKKKRSRSPAGSTCFLLQRGVWRAFLSGPVSGPNGP